MQWMNIFATNDSFPLLYKLISIVFSMPVSNAFVERVFSLVSAQWSKERNSLSEKTVKSILQVKVNLEASCGEVQQILCKNKELLDQILSSAKYNYVDSGRTGMNTVHFVFYISFLVLLLSLCFPAVLIFGFILVAALAIMLNVFFAPSLRLRREIKK